MPDFNALQPSEPDPGAPADPMPAAVPFRRQREKDDPVRKAIVIALAVASFVFLVSMIAVLMMHAPSL